MDWNKSNCSENLPNSKIYIFLLVLAVAAPLSVNITTRASTATVTISSASCHPSRNPLFRKKQVTPVIFLSEGDGSRDDDPSRPAGDPGKKHYSCIPQLLLLPTPSKKSGYYNFPAGRRIDFNIIFMPAARRGITRWWWCPWLGWWKMYPRRYIISNRTEKNWGDHLKWLVDSVS